MKGAAVENFADRLMKAVETRNTCACIGLDPRLENIPAPVRDAAFKSKGKTLAGAAEAVRIFSFGVVDAVCGLVPAVKPQSAFFEMFGFEGVRVYAEVVSHAKSKGLIVIGDVKRGDIGSTAEAYAQAHLSAPPGFESTPPFGADAITVNPYFGDDGVKPFVDAAAPLGKGIFVLGRTSNPSAGILQDAKCASGAPVYIEAGRMAERLGASCVGKCGFSAVGVVAGATYPEEAALLREELKSAIFLVPGYGAQGAKAQDLSPFFIGGRGAIVNASRSVIFAFKDKKYSGKFGENRWQDAVRAAASDMAAELAFLTK
jgi:orotidine-5'-phosphate decarboxylase